MVVEDAPKDINKFSWSIYLFKKIFTRLNKKLKDTYLLICLLCCKEVIKQKKKLDKAFLSKKK